MRGCLILALVLILPMGLGFASAQTTVLELELVPTQGNGEPGKNFTTTARVTTSGVAPLQARFTAEAPAGVEVSFDPVSVNVIPGQAATSVVRIRALANVTIATHSIKIIVQETTSVFPNVPAKASAVYSLKVEAPEPPPPPAGLAVRLQPTSLNLTAVRGERLSFAVILESRSNLTQNMTITPSYPAGWRDIARETAVSLGASQSQVLNFTIEPSGAAMSGVGEIRFANGTDSIKMDLRLTVTEPASSQPPATENSTSGSGSGGNESGTPAGGSGSGTAGGAASNGAPAREDPLMMTVSPADITIFLGTTARATIVADWIGESERIVAFELDLPAGVTGRMPAGPFTIQPGKAIEVAFQLDAASSLVAGTRLEGAVLVVGEPLHEARFRILIDEEVVPLETTTAQDDAKTLSPIVVGSIIGGAGLLLAVVVFVIFLVARRKSEPKEEREPVSRMAALNVPVRGPKPSPSLTPARVQQRTLRLVGERGPMSLSAIASELGTDRGALLPHIDTLVTDGRLARLTRDGGVAYDLPTPGGAKQPTFDIVRR